MAEVFSPPRATAAVIRNPGIGVLPAGAYDIRPGPDGSSRDFSRPGVRGRAIRSLGARRPFLLVGGPPCTGRCSLNQNINHRRASADE
eukprot:9253238-Alexandrium_andersonii.AAC.1